MTAYGPLFMECAALLLIWSVATVLSAPLRRRLQYEPDQRRRIAQLPLDLLAHVSRPALVLLLTEAALVLLRTSTAGTAWLDAHPTHVSAWLMFWIGVGILLLADGTARAVFHLRGQGFPIPDLLLDIIRALAVVAIGFGVLSAEMGVDIGPLLASTALLTAVVGFALQGVLGNLMAGMSLHLVRSLRPGEWVEIDGITGRVVKTNWRETRLRTRGGHLHIIPNSKVAEARINNLDDPTPLRRHMVEVGASYSDAPDEVIEALLCAARAVPEVRSSPAPDAMITAYLDFGINYRLDFWTRDYSRHSPIAGAVNRMIWYQFKRRGIEIPFPMSDKLLNDFMAVVYNQRRLPPTDTDLEATVTDLLRSDLCTRLLVDEAGAPLLDRAALAAVAPLVKRRPYTHGETLCRQGEDSDEFWVLVRGRLQGEVRGTDGEPVVFALVPGALVGEMSALTGLPRSATITVAESAELLEFGDEAFAALLGLHEAVPERLSDLAAGRAASNREALEVLARGLGEGRDVQLERAGILGRLRRMLGRR